MKLRLIKAYSTLSDEIKAKIQDRFPHGTKQYLVNCKNQKGETYKALPFETEEYYYLVKMPTEAETRAIIAAQAKLDEKEADSILEADIPEELMDAEIEFDDD